MKTRIDKASTLLPSTSFSRKIFCSMYDLRENYSWSPRDKSGIKIIQGGGTVPEHVAKLWGKENYSWVIPFHGFAVPLESSRVLISFPVSKTRDKIPSPIPTGPTTITPLIINKLIIIRGTAFMPSMDEKKSKPVLDVLGRKKPSRVPFWLMRQAGRYLPEYRDLRSYASGFLGLVYDPVKAAEVTIQPIRRFGMDAAILFSDILVVPHALGQRVEFLAGEGPKLDPIYNVDDLSRLDLSGVKKQASPVYETVSLVRQMLTAEGFDETTLIGFCGSPWTVACYMVEGRGSRDFERPRRWALSDPAGFQKLIDIVSDASIEYLSGQVEAGAEALQLFDSWAGILDADQFAKWVIAPTKKIVSAMKEKYPAVPIIGFPRGAGTLSLPYAKETGVDCIGLDYTMDPVWAAGHLCPLLPVQGNLDPARLLSGGTALEDGMNAIHEAFKGKNFIFNLGHGVIKETEIAHVERLSKIVRGWTS